MLYHCNFHTSNILIYWVHTFHLFYLCSPASPLIILCKLKGFYLYTRFLLSFSYFFPYLLPPLSYFNDHSLFSVSYLTFLFNIFLQVVFPGSSESMTRLYHSCFTVASVTTSSLSGCLRITQPRKDSDEKGFQHSFDSLKINHILYNMSGLSATFQEKKALFPNLIQFT